MTQQITPEALYAALKTQSVKIIDGSWALDGTDMLALFSADHIPTAQFFDIDTLNRKESSLPHMAPSPEQFANAMGHMGISEKDHVVISDRQGLFSAARVWWTFKLMGHENVQVLRGGLPAWKACGFSTAGEPSAVIPARYIARQDDRYVINLKELYETLNDEHYLILDARPKARFEGMAPEPRAGLRSGHMPSSQNLPFADLIDQGALRPIDDLRSVFKSMGADKADTVVTSCGSGVTAAIISLALTEAGYPPSRLYDGSWAEWGQIHMTTPVVINGD